MITKTQLQDLRDDFSRLNRDIKTDLDKLYSKLGLKQGQFSSQFFDIRQENDKIIVDIPFMRSNNEHFQVKLSNSSKKVILENLKKKGINKKKSDFKYVGNANGLYNANIYSIL